MARTVRSAAALVMVLLPALTWAQSNPQENGYIALGDSVAAGEGAIPVATGYAYRLHEEAAFGRRPKMDFGNSAVRGARNWELRDQQSGPGRDAKTPQVRVTGSHSAFEDGLLLASPDAGSSVPIVRQDADTVTLRTNDTREITLLRSDRRVSGHLASADSATLTIARDGDHSVTIPRSAIVRYEREDGRRSRRRGVLLGLAVGTVGGAVIGWAHGQGCRSSGGFDFSCAGQPAASTVAGALLGGGGGALVGAFLPRPQRWRSVPLPAVNP